MILHSLWKGITHDYIYENFFYYPCHLRKYKQNDIILYYGSFHSNINLINGHFEVVSDY